MKSLKLFAVLALCMSFAGCDINAFTEDWDDAQLIPPYVGFDIAQLDTGGWLYSAANDEAGQTRNTVRNVVNDPHVGPAEERGPVTPISVAGLRVRLPVAIGEDVTVTYELSGTAVPGVDYEIPGRTGNTGSITINFTDEDTEDATSSPFFRNVPITILPRELDSPSGTIRIDLVSATAASGRTINIGRFPNNRDSRATLSIFEGAFARSISCPTVLVQGQQGDFSAVMRNLNPTSTGPIALDWLTGGVVRGQGLNAQFAIPVPANTVDPVDVTVTFRATGPTTTAPVNVHTRTCVVRVIPAD